VSAGIQTALAIGGYALPVDPVRLAAENCFEVRFILHELRLDEDQIAAAEEAVELARRGAYPVGRVA
jgi:hypothetical protein